MSILELIIEVAKQNRRKIIKEYNYIRGDKKVTLKSPYVLVDGSSHGNLGDQAISYAESLFIYNNTNKVLTTILDFESDKSLKYLREKDNLILLFQGGGNFGTLYPAAEALRRLVINKFKDNKIILFPQSIYFSSDVKGKYELALTKKIYAKHRNLTLIARDPKSYNLMLENFPNNRVILTPDIVLSLDIHEQFDHIKREGIITLLRNDQEKNISSIESIELQKLIRSKNAKVTESDTHIGSKYDQSINVDNREGHLFNIWNNIASHELVITDRLHGMIFAYITKTPCIVFENNNHKILETYKHWLKDCNFIRLIKNNSEVESAIDELSTITPEMLDFTEAFEPLVKVLK